MSLDVSICPDFSPICVLSALVSSSLYLLFDFTFGLGSLLMASDVIIVKLLRLAADGRKHSSQP